MEKILGNPQIRNLFYITISCLIIILIIIRYLVTLNMDFSFLNPILDNLIASLVATVFIGAFIFYVSPKSDDLKLEIIEPSRIQLELRKGRQQTDYWYYSGGTGTFTKAVTIPELAKLARSMNKRIDIQLQIINPDNIEICQKYSDYRRGLRSANNEGRKWTVDYVRNQSYGTIIKSLIIGSQEPLLDLSIGLKNHFSLFRFDISSDNAVITKEDPREVAFVFYRKSTSYHSYVHEFKETFKQARKIKNIRLDFSLEELTLEKLRVMTEELGIYPDFTDRNAKIIIDLVQNYKNPYA